MCIFIYAVKAEIWPRCTAWGKTGSIRVERGLYRKLVLNIFSRPSRQFWSFIKKSTQFFEDVFLKKKYLSCLFSIWVVKKMTYFKSIFDQRLKKSFFPQKFSFFSFQVDFLTIPVKRCSFRGRANEVYF